MTKTIAFNRGIAERYMERVGGGNHYLFATKGEDDTSPFGIRKLLSEVTFGKAITESDVAFVTPNVQWERGVVYNYYDDRSSVSADFIATSPTDGANTRHIFKCLWNNNGSMSTQQPQYNAFSVQSSQTTSDGYVWRYIATVEYEEYKKFATGNMLPIKTSPEVAAATTDGIEVVVVENAGKGYTTMSGDVKGLGLVVGELQRVYLNASQFSRATGFYFGQTIFISDVNGLSSKLYRVESSGYDSVGDYVDIIGYDEEENIIELGHSFIISPSIEFDGDGEGVVATPIIEDGAVKSIRIISKGQGYTKAVCRIVRPVFDFNPSGTNSSVMDAVIRPIISPEGGHGSNAHREMNVSSFVVSVAFSETDTNIPKTNTYSSILLVGNPEFNSPVSTAFDNRIMVEVADVTGVIVGEVLTQTNGFKATVHEVDTLNNIIYLSKYYDTPLYGVPEENMIHDTYEILDVNMTLNGLSVNLNIIDMTSPPYVWGTGEVLSILQIGDVERTDTSNEQFKLILEF